MKFVRWIGDYWVIPLVVVAAIVGMVVLSKKKRHWSAVQKITQELKGIEAKRETREIQLQLGAEQAKQHVAEKYAARRETLDAKHEARAKELEDDPVALSRYLARLTDDG